MKKIFLALMSTALLVFVPACKEPAVVPDDPQEQTDTEDPSNPSDPSDPQNSDEDKNLSKWEKVLKYVEPGVYQGKVVDLGELWGTVDRTNEILVLTAKGEAIIIRDKNQSGPFPAIQTYDGKLTVEDLTSGFDGGEPRYNRKIAVHSKEQLKSAANMYAHIGYWQNTIFATAFFDGVFVDETKFLTFYEKKYDAPDFNTAYQNVFKIIGTSPIKPADMFLVEHTIYDDGWHNDMYPADMNDKRWVVPYDGKGTIERITVYRQRGWSDYGHHFVFYGPCAWDNIFKVECDVVDCDWDGAKQWYDRITAMTDRYNKVNTNYTSCVNGDVDLYGDGSKIVNMQTAQYDYYSEPRADEDGHHYGNDASGVEHQFTEKQEDFGIGGWVTPHYQMIWTPNYGFVTPMVVTFNIDYTTWI